MTQRFVHPESNESPGLQPDIVIAGSFWARFRGLMLSRPLSAKEAFLIPRCASVHTFFMRYALDLVYLDQHGAVVKLVRNVKPWRMSWGGHGAAQTLEMTAGGIERYAIQVGDAIVTSSNSEKYHVAQTS